jgi:hypothetical protein
VGTRAGYRIVIGRWPSSPYGSFADVMMESPGGTRTLFAPDQQIADFVATTYRFDEVRIVPVVVERQAGSLTCRAGELTVRLEIGSSTFLGRVLRVVPRRVAESPTWCTLVDPIARVTMRGVRTRGTAGGGRVEWYGATAQHRIESVVATYAGTDLGALTDVDPPVRFGFSSTPRRPCIVSVTTTIRTDGA